MRIFFATVLSVLLNGPALAAGHQLLSPYNLGISYDLSTSYASIGYNSDRAGHVLPDDCEAKSAQIMHCTAYLAPDGGDEPSVGLFIDTPFVRQGLLYFDYGFSLATVSYKGGIVQKPSSVRTPSSVKKKGDRPDPQKPEQPITKAYLELYGVNWQGYLRFGVTPRFFPDLLVKTGIGVQTVGGRVKILTEDSVHYVAQPSAFAEAELVLVRMKTGALSVYAGTDQSLLALGPSGGTKLVEDHPAGTELEDFRVTLRLASAGVRVLFPF